MTRKLFTSLLLFAFLVSPLDVAFASEPKTVESVPDIPIYFFIDDHGGILGIAPVTDEFFLWAYAPFALSSNGDTLTGNNSRYGNTGDASSTPSSTTLFTYDDNGNLTSFASTTNTWNYQNQLTQVVTASGTSAYSYDPSGQRIKLAEGTSTTLFPTKFYSASLGGAATTTEHIFANGMLVATVTNNASSSVETRYVLTDHLGGVSVVTDSSGAIAEAIDYYPYGGLRVDSKTSPYPGERRKYIGQMYDAGTGLSYLNARYYDGNRGQFMSQDPVFWSNKQNLQDPQSLNSYSYAENNPITNKDPSGQISLAQISATLSQISDTLRNISNTLAQIGVSAVKQAGQSTATGFKQATGALSQGSQNAYNNFANNPSAQIIVGGVGLAVGGSALLRVAGGGTALCEKYCLEAEEGVGRVTTLMKELNPSQRTIQKINDISGFTKHGLNQIINNNVSPQAVKDAITNTLQYEYRVDSFGRESWRYIGENATLNFNSTKELITSWLTK